MRNDPPDIFGSRTEKKADSDSSSPLQARPLYRILKNGASWSHLLSIVTLVLISLALLPEIPEVNFGLAVNRNISNVRQRQLVLEALDKIVRYQHYHHEVHGRFTRDLSRLGLPSQLSHGTYSELKDQYEFSVLEAEPHRLLVLVSGRRERITMDDRHRVNANFALPAPHRAYLQEEADRVLQLYTSGEGRVSGLYSGYWKIEKHGSAQGSAWLAIGTKAPVLGERREFPATAQRQIASIFGTVSSQVRSRLELSRSAPSVTAASVRGWLERVHQAQYVAKREFGHYAGSWDELKRVADIDFLPRAGELKLVSFDRGSDAYRITVEGLQGEILGEQFVLDETGQVKQIRYTDSLIGKLQESTELLRSAAPFQVTEIDAGGGAVLDSKKSNTLQSNK